MLGKTKAFSGFSVDDIEKARQFYGDTLGIDTSEQSGLLTLHLAGGRDTLVYPKPDHTPAAYTILNFEVDDIDQAVDGLASRGVQFERYDGLGQDEKGINRAGGPYIAWFKDPGWQHPVRPAAALTHSPPGFQARRQLITIQRALGHQPVQCEGVPGRSHRRTLAATGHWATGPGRRGHWASRTLGDGAAAIVEPVTRHAAG